MQEIRSDTVLPSRRESLVLQTTDGQSLVAELALPVDAQPLATLIMLHPLPTHGGMMDSHIFRKAANRLPALANYAILRFNTRGTESQQGKSTGSFDSGISESEDLAAAIAFADSRDLPNIWLVGWSFGTELAIKYGPNHSEISGAILLSPPLRRATDQDLMRWNEFGKPLIALVPELDEFLTPDQAVPRFEIVPHAVVVPALGAKHLWVGEAATRFVLNQVVDIATPGKAPLPTEVVA